MKMDRQNITVALLVCLILGLLFQNRSLNRRLAGLESKIDEVMEYSETASNYAREASENAFGNKCSECPEDLRRRY